MNANRFESKRREYRKKQLDKGEQEKEKNMGYNSASIKQWPLHNKEFEAMKNTESKFSILESLPDDNIQEINMLKDRMIINKWEGDRRKEAEENAQKAHKENGCMVEDIMDDVSELNENVVADEIDGRDTNILN
ncbi:hypothetical protein Tco_0895128 [Tanacetum coccineum]|uniref:Uncharacterized protein n=1 Tax=Tanacetum coccineum TaxID=301880 RepID=A0ABQ5CDN1_9ASTR